MPCPAGVNISASFRAWNKFHMYQSRKAACYEWDIEVGADHQPKNCEEFGKCEQACPQKISIREDLKKVQADLG